MDAIKPYWFFIAGLVLVLLFVLVVRPPRRHHWIPGSTRHLLGPGGTRRLLGYGAGDYAEYFENPEGSPRFTMFGVDWCPHCVAAKPIFESLGSTVTIDGKTVALRYVNPEKEKEAAAGFQIDGYPTFVLENKGQKVKYPGPRTADGIRQWLSQQLA
jgi:thiol-disulfide isomerase/thioredoxin